MKKKVLRVFSLMLALLLVIAASIVNVTALGETESNGEYEYITLDGGVIQLLRYIGQEEIVNIPEEIDGKPVTHIGDRCFIAKKVKEIHIPKTLVHLYTSPADVFLNENLESIYVDEENPIFASSDGILFNKDYTTLYYYPTAKEGDYYEVPTTVSKIDTMSFYGNIFLKKIEVNSNVNEIASFALQNMKSLEEVKYSVVENGEGSIFQQCENLSKVYIGENVQKLNDYDFTYSPNVVLYVYKNSYGEKFAKSNNFKYVIVSKYESKTLVDDKTKVEVSGNIDSEAYLNVEYNNINYNITDKLEYVVGYNITLLKDGKEIQPIDKVTIRIPYTGESVDKITVYRAEIDGTFTSMQAKYEDGYFVFETEHLSDYLLFKKVDNSETSPEESNVESSNISDDSSKVESSNIPNDSSKVVSIKENDTSTISQNNNTSTETSVDVPKTGDNTTFYIIGALVLSFTCTILVYTSRKKVEAKEKK